MKCFNDYVLRYWIFDQNYFNYRKLIDSNLTSFWIAILKTYVFIFFYQKCSYTELLKTECYVYMHDANVDIYENVRGLSMYFLYHNVELSCKNYRDFIEKKMILLLGGEILVNLTGGRKEKAKKVIHTKWIKGSNLKSRQVCYVNFHAYDIKEGRNSSIHTQILDKSQRWLNYKGPCESFASRRKMHMNLRNVQKIDHQRQSDIQLKKQIRWDAEHVSNI